MKKKNRSHRYNINRPRSRHRHKCSKYKTCLSMIMIICVKQNLSNIWSSIHKKVKQHLMLSWKKHVISKIFLSVIATIIHFFINQKFCNHHFLCSQNNDTINLSSIYCLIYVGAKKVFHKIMQHKEI